MRAPPLQSYEIRDALSPELAGGENMEGKVKKETPRCKQCNVVWHVTNNQLFLL
jgi:hypothetical protein